MSVINRRNAVIGWGVWKIGKRVLRRKAKSAAPSVEGGRPNKSLLALTVAGLAGALTFWRSRSSSGDES